jgi:hypothetical protein
MPIALAPLRIRSTSSPVGRASSIQMFLCALTLALAVVAANAQFKEVGPAPFPPAVARQKIRTSLDSVTPGNRQRTIASLTGLLPWYRDILDDELIAAWKRNTTTNVTEVIEALADARVASGVVGYAWREQREMAFTLANAPVLAHLMARYPQSADPFLADLRGEGPTGQPPSLSPQEAEAICRILVDMPDLATGKKTRCKFFLVTPKRRGNF